MANLRNRLSFPRILTYRHLLVLILGLLALTVNSMADIVERYNCEENLTASGSDLSAVQTFNGEFPEGSGNITTPADGDVIKVSENISVSTTISPTNNFTLQAKSNPVTISHSGSQTRLYNLSNTVTTLTLKNVTISGFGINYANGGAIIIQNSESSVSLTNDNVTFTGNTAGEYGGAIYSSRSLIISGETTFAGNKALNDGAGAIYVVSGKRLTISGKTTFTGNTSDYGGAIYVSNDQIIFEGDDSVGTFTDNVSTGTEVGAIGGHDIRAYHGNLKFKDKGTYSFDGGITAPQGSTDINEAQVTIAGRENCATNRYQFGSTTISNGGKLIAKLDYINTIDSTPITLSDSVSLVELTNVLMNQTATIKSSTGDGAFILEYLAAEGNVQKESLVISSGRIDTKGCMKAVIEVGSDATFSPGNSVGDLDLDGSKFTLDGEMLIEVDRTGADTFVCGEFELDNGTVTLYWPNDEIPFFATCDLITSTSDLSGVLENLEANLDFSTSPTVEQLYNDGYITVSLFGDNNNIVRLSVDRNAVPEPSTWALLALGVAGLLYVRKRTRK